MAKAIQKNILIMPVVKWAGGKRQLLEKIRESLPKQFSTYYEPFFGGGALLFDMQPQKAIINDLNGDLISAYEVIKNNSDKLLEILKEHEELNNEEYFYTVRDMDRKSIEYSKLTNIEKAARLIYLNKTCFNGLFRVNSSGQFNTPYGRYKNPNIVNEPIIKAVSKYFNENEIKILSVDFELAIKDTKEGDFVYLDPPYDPISNTSSFTGYNEIIFNKSEQERLKKVCDELNKKGVKFLLSNSATDYIKDLYKDYNIEIVKAKRSINCNGLKRGDIDEVLVRNYK